VQNATFCLENSVLVPDTVVNVNRLYNIVWFCVLIKRINRFLINYEVFFINTGMKVISTKVGKRM